MHLEIIAIGFFRYIILLRKEAFSVIKLTAEEKKKIRQQGYIL